MFVQQFSSIILERKLIFCFCIVSEKGYSLYLNYAIKKLLCLGYKKLPSDEAMGYKQSEVAILTFDDGYQDFSYNTYNILKKYNTRAIIFLIADFIDKNTFSESHSSEADSKIIDQNIFKLFK